MPPRDAGPPGSPHARGGRTYLVALLAVSVAFAVIAYLVAADIGPPPAWAAILLMVAGLGIPTALWWGADAEGVLPAAERVALVSVGLAWLLTVSTGALRGEPLTPFTLLVPLLVLFLLLKPASRRSGEAAAVRYAWILVGVSAAALVLEITGLLPSWYVIVAGSQGQAVAAGDSGYWLAVNGALGLDGRWGGPFLHPNLAGPVGAFLVVLGASRSGAARVGLVVAGVLVLLLTSSRTSWVAAVGGLATLGAAWWLSRPGRMPRSLRVATVTVAAMAFAFVWVRSNPGLSGRMTVWPAFLDLGASSPLWGVGQTGIDNAIASGLLPGWAHHGHNVVIDAFARTGAVGVVLTLVVVVAALVAAGRAAKRGAPLALALVVMLLILGLTETTFRWGLLTPTLAALILALVVSQSDRGVAAAPPRGVPGPGSDPDPDREPSAAAD